MMRIMLAIGLYLIGVVMLYWIWLEYGREAAVAAVIACSLTTTACVIASLAWSD